MTRVLYSGRRKIYERKRQSNDRIENRKTTSACFIFAFEKCQLFIERLHVSINYFKPRALNRPADNYRNK